MDVSKVKNLSDDQLVALYRNPSTPKEAKRIVLKELSLRETDGLSSEISKEENDEFTQNQKLHLIFLPFLFRKHRETMFKDSWSGKKDKQFWNYITLGLAIYTGAMLIGLLFRNR